MILPGLMLFAGCLSSVPRPSVTPTTSGGNAYRLLLPAGTIIQAPDDATAAQIRAVTVNEATAGAGRTIKLTAPLQLVSPAYIAGRNATELTLLELLAQLRAENTQLRSAK